MTSEVLQEARSADLFWRALRAQLTLAYVGAGAYIALSAVAADATPYLLVAVVLLAIAGAGYMTRQARRVLAPHRDVATGELPFERAPLRLSHLVALRPPESRA